MTTPKMTREGLREIGEEVRRSMGHAVAPDGSIPTSPEMGTYSTEAIFALVWGRPGLDRRYRMLATLAVLTPLRELVELRIYINTALNGLLTPLEIQEAVVHCSLYAGQPAVVNATAAMRKVFEERGVAVEQPVRPYVSLEELERRGRATRERLLGPTGTSGTVYDTVPGLRELLWCYPFGEVFHRPGLDTKSRVVCTVAALTALRANTQIALYAKEHARAGLTREEVAEVMVQTGPYAGFPAMLNGLSILADAVG